MIFESHAHYEDEKFDPDRVELLSLMREKNVGRIINVGSSLDTSRKSLELAKKYDDIYAAIGLHPESLDDMEEESIAILRKLASEDKTVAIGEIGLDYYWAKEPDVQEKQRQYFKKQLILAEEMNLPVIIHSRDAAADTMELMRWANQADIQGVVHCFSYSKEIALELVKMGYYIGVGGVVTFKNGRKLRETVEAIPLEKILLETDCPYMAPEPNRGSRNDSTLIRYVVQTISEIKGVSIEEVEEVTWNNAFTLFHKVK